MAKVVPLNGRVRIEASPEDVVEAAKYWLWYWAKATHPEIFEGRNLKHGFCVFQDGKFICVFTEPLPFPPGVDKKILNAVMEETSVSGIRKEGG